MTGKKKVLLASVLKPLDDPRMAGKFAASLAGSFEAVLLGQPGQVPDGCIAVAVKPFGRLSWRRFAFPFRFLLTLMGLRPSLAVVHAVELLPFAALYCLLSGCKLVYDVQENYMGNILAQGVYGRWLRWPLARAVRLAEWACRPLTAHYILAERCYVAECPFVAGKYTVLENKALRAEGLARPKNAWHGGPFPPLLKLLFCGTVSPHYGIWEAVDLAERLYRAGTALELAVVGKAGAALRKRLEARAKQLTFLTLDVREEAVPHRQVLAAMHLADLVLLPYPPNPSTWQCIPTKMFECLAYGLPMLVQQNPLWDQLCAGHSAAVFTDFASVPAKSLTDTLLAHRFYPAGPWAGAFWDLEGKTLLELAKSLTNGRAGE